MDPALRIVFVAIRSILSLIRRQARNAKNNCTTPPLKEVDTLRTVELSCIVQEISKGDQHEHGKAHAAGWVRAQLPSQL